MCDNDLVVEWSIFNDILTDCNESQSQYDIDMRSDLEEEIQRRGGTFDARGKTHVFSGFHIYEKSFVEVNN